MKIQLWKHNIVKIQFSWSHSENTIVETKYSENTTSKRLPSTLKIGNIFITFPKLVMNESKFPLILYYFFLNCNDITMVDEKTHPILLVLALVSNILHTRAYRHSYTITLLTRARTRNIGFVFSSTIVMAHYRQNQKYLQ